MHIDRLPDSIDNADPGQAQHIRLRPGRLINVRHHQADPGQQTTVFLCHGAGGNMQQWRHQWQVLREAGYNLVAWDALGHGLSGRPRQRQAYAGTELVADYASLLTRYGSARNVLVAHSYGSRQTLALLQQLQAENATAPIRGIVLLGAQGPQAGFSGQLARTPVWLLTLMRRRLERGFRQLAWHPSANQELVATEEKVARRNSLFVFKSLTSQPVTLQLDSLPLINLPALLLAGDSDGLTPAAGSRELADLLPQAEFCLLDRCGHQIMLEKPAETSAAVLGFVQRVTSGN